MFLSKSGPIEFIYFKDYSLYFPAVMSGVYVILPLFSYDIC